MTRHSNLAEVHVVFHLVVDESVRTVTADISSRHPVLLGYRNVLKACFRYDIRTITLPLLLVHEMSEVGTHRLPTVFSHRAFTHTVFVHAVSQNVLLVGHLLLQDICSHICS